MGWLDQLKGMFGGKPETPRKPAPARGLVARKPEEIPFERMSLRAIVEADLSRINAKAPGLGDAAAHYVLTGTGREVLDRLAEVEVGTSISAQGQMAHRGELTRGRQYVLANFLGAEPDLCLRYAQVLSASLRQGYRRNEVVAEVPHPVQDFLGNVQYGVPLNTEKDRVERFRASFTAANVMAFNRAAGGTAADLLVVLFHDRHGGVQKLRDCLDKRALALADPAALIPAAARLPAEGRIALVAAAGVATEPGLSFVIDMAGNNLKAVREAAVKALAGGDPSAVEAQAVARLKTGDATMREAMAGLLASSARPSARAALEAHLPSERAAAVRAVIERQAKGEALRSAVAGTDDATGYTALGGVRVDVPPLRAFRPHPGGGLGPADEAELMALFRPFAARLAADEATRMAKYPTGTPNPQPKPESVAALVAFLNGDWTRAEWRGDHRFVRLVNEGPAKGWMLRALGQVSQEAGLRFALGVRPDRVLFMDRGQNASQAALWAYAEAPEGDLRQSMRLIDDLGYKNAERSYLGDMITTYRFSRIDWVRDVPAAYLWPWLVKHLPQIERGLTPAQLAGQTDLLKIIELLRLFPATPERVLAPLLDRATGIKRDGRAAARALLAGLPKLDGHLVEMLADKRQAVRAVVADWLADLGAKTAVPALEKALAKESAAQARAAMLGALSRLGGNLEPFVGEAVLNRAAAEGLKKADFALLAWMEFKTMPPLTWRSGAAVPRDTKMFWLYQALRLKAPGETQMFAVYLEQCDAAKAQVFSTWVFDAWLDWAERDAHIRATQYYGDPGQWAEDRDPWGGMPKSIDSKGILALGVAADGRHAARRVRAFLKKNGQQSQHCAALIELLAAKADPASLQVVLAAATRIKQKSLQKLSGDLVAAIAEERGWTEDELADRTVPDCGLDGDGKTDLPMGVGRPDYQMRLSEALELVLLNPAGQVVKALPASDDAEAAESKSLWAATRKEVAATAEMQAGRLHEAMVAGRAWGLEDWQRDTLGHPIMAALACQLVWQGLDADGASVRAFRPLAGGGGCGPLGDRVGLDGITQVRLAHGALMAEDEVKAWEAYVRPRRVKPPVAQFARAVRRLHPDMATHTQIADREGWLTDTFTIRGIAKRLGYDRGEIVDSGGFSTYVRRYSAAGLEAVLTFSGSGVPEENLPASPLHVSFRGIGGRNEMPLAKVPPVLLSEGWNDYHDLAAKGRYDPNWLSLMPFM